MIEEPTYEERMGDWVAQRCQKRATGYPDRERPMPDYVKDWLDHGGKSAPDGDTAPTPSVQVWLTRTIDDPDWPESHHP